MIFVALKKETFLPNGSLVLLRPIRPDTEIALPDTYKDEMPRCEIVAIGPGRSFETGVPEKIPFDVGDIVLVGGDATIVKLNGEEFHLIDWRKLLGKIK